MQSLFFAFPDFVRILLSPVNSPSSASLCLMVDTEQLAKT